MNPSTVFGDLTVELLRRVIGLIHRGVFGDIVVQLSWRLKGVVARGLFGT